MTHPTTFLSQPALAEITETLRLARKKIEELELALDLVEAERDSLRRELEIWKDGRDA